MTLIFSMNGMFVTVRIMQTSKAFRRTYSLLLIAQNCLTPDSLVLFVEFITAGFRSLAAAAAVAQTQAGAFFHCPTFSSVQFLDLVEVPMKSLA